VNIGQRLRQEKSEREAEIKRRIFEKVRRKMAELGFDDNASPFDVGLDSRCPTGLITFRKKK
jgi:hypothetical protein